ncbi:MFS transporter [Nonomuraea sp. B5E05]|uniref:MFS transporter n=1 Tax=Nonomuraea sp. B5E05 TaxID=3153569 RepID=UPI0032604EEC
MPHPSSPVLGPEPAQGHPRRRSILAALCAALLVMSVSVMAVTVALPSIAADLRATTTQLQWITESMVLALAALLLPMGALADRYGRRRVLLAGLAVFAIASLLAAITRTPGQLIAARALMGMGNAMITPATLAIVRAVFPASALPRALAVWGAVASAGVVLGPLSGGVLVEHFGWRSLFFANAAILLPAALSIGRLAPAFAPRAKAALDVPSILLIAAGLPALIHTIIEAPRRGWLDPFAFAAAALLAGFVLRQRRTAHPLLDLPMVAARSFWPAAVAAATGFLSLMGVLFLITQYWQDVRAFSPSTTALLLLPTAAGQLAVAPFAPRLIARRGVRLVALAGLLGLAAGLMLITTGLRTQDWILATGLGLVAAGNGMAVNAASTAMLASGGQRQAGSAAAVNETAFKLGGSLGVAAFGAVITGHLTARLTPHHGILPPDMTPFATQSITGAMQAARHLGGPEGAWLARVAGDAFIDGFGQAALLAAVLAIAAALTTLALLEPHHLPKENRS